MDTTIDERKVALYKYMLERGTMLPERVPEPYFSLIFGYPKPESGSSPK